MKRFLSITIGFFLILACTQAQERYDQIRIWTQDTGMTLGELIPLGIDGEGLNVRRDVYIDLAVSESEKMLLQQAGFQFEDIIVDLSEHYANQLSQTHDREFGLGSMGGYYTLDEIIDNMDSLHVQYPHIVSAKDSIGSSYEGRTIWAFKISDNPNEDESEPEVFYNSLTHAREPAGMMTVMYYAWQLVEAYETDELMTYLVNERELWFVPVINPDGYAYNELMNPDGGGMHRKNMRPVCTSLPGVDLNRNWGYQWGFDDEGSSPDPCQSTYRGNEAFSEPETRTIRDFIRDHEFITIFNYHSHGNLLLRPYGYAAEIPLNGDDEAIYSELGQDLVSENLYIFGTGEETLNYFSNGDALDFQYGELGIISFLPEVGSWAQGGFWPPSDLVFELAHENLSMNMHLAGVAGSWIRLEDLVLEDEQSLEPGMLVSAALSVRNKGLGEEVQATSLSFHSPDSSISTPAEPLDISGIPPQFDLLLDGPDLSFEILAASGSTANLIVSVNAGDAYTVQDTFSWNVGYPDTVWAEDFENDGINWTSSSWDITWDAYEGDYALTESPLGDYPELSTLTTTLNQSIDLRGYSSAQLYFNAKWDIEVDYDFCQVLASIDGGESWQALGGDFTSLGNGATVQPLNEPGYHGSSDWIRESMSLNAFAGEANLLLRFETLSDTYYEGDGFIVDNMQLLGWGIGFHAGDVTRDGLVNISDLTLVVEWIIENESLAPDAMELSDLNTDSALNVLDVILIIETIQAQ